MIATSYSRMFLKLMTDHGSRGRDQRYVACRFIRINDTRQTSACTRAILFHRRIGTYIIYIL